MGRNEFCCRQMEQSGAVSYEDDNDRREFWIYDNEDDRDEFIRYCPFCGTDLKEE